MSTPKPMTPAQTAALLALHVHNANGHTTPATATDLGVSPAALAALVRKGLAEYAGTWRRSLFSEPTVYRLTTTGRMKARRMIRDMTTPTA